MKKWIQTCIPVVFGLIAWADAEALRLSDFDRPDLATLGMGLPELSRTRLRARKAVAAGQTEDVFIKFRQEPVALAFKVNAADVDGAVARIQVRNDVEFVEPNRRLQRQFIPSDPLLGNQWHHEKISSPNAWDWGTGSAAVKVAIVDAPFNLAHPDLAANSTDGWDVLNEVTINSGADDHATMSAGMTSGVLDNSTGIAGTGNFTLVPVNNAYADLTTDIPLIDSAIRWAADNGIRVVNISWDGAYSPVLNLAAEYHRTMTDGIVVMAGVNGSGFLNYTNQPFIVAVSMTDSSDTLQSHYGPHIDFSAPGYQVYTTTGANGYDSGDGTSFAAPLVAGILASLFSIQPSLTAEDALAVLRTTAVDLGPAGRDDFFGWGRVDYGAAAWLAAAVAGDVPDLGADRFDVLTNGIQIAAEFHPGVVYTLKTATNLNQASWSTAEAQPVTNGTMVQFTVGAEEEDTAFYRIIGEVDF